MTTPDEFQANPVHHRYAGNGWAIVQTLKDDWSRAIYIGKGEVGHQIFLMWSKLLKAEGAPLNPQLLPKINAIRTKLSSGKWTVKHTRLVEVV